jgi:hypothetical protein
MVDYLIISENLVARARLNKNWKVLIVRRLERGKINEKLISNTIGLQKIEKYFGVFIQVPSNYIINLYNNDASTNTDASNINVSRLRGSAV